MLQTQPNLGDLGNLPATSYAHKRQDIKNATQQKTTLQALQTSMNNTGAIYEPNVEILNVTTNTNGSMIPNNHPNI
jgi:hypothetical protein